MPRHYFIYKTATAPTKTASSPARPNGWIREAPLLIEVVDDATLAVPAAVTLNVVVAV